MITTDIELATQNPNEKDWSSCHSLGILDNKERERSCFCCSLPRLWRLMPERL